MSRLYEETGADVSSHQEMFAKRMRAFDTALGTISKGGGWPVTMGASHFTISGFETEAQQLYRVASAAVRRAFRGSSADHEDLLQLVLERVVRSLNEGKFSGQCSLTTWVTVIARHATIDILRAGSRNPEFRGMGSLRGAAAASPIDFERRLEARAALGEVECVLERMPSAHAETIVLHDMLGHHLEEVAAITGVSVAAAQSRLVRGRKELKRRLLEREETGG
jgi:RNA polymerase sigma-70 factor (ECF subfamily)